MVEAGLTHLVTADRNLEYQQNIAIYPVQFVVLVTFDNRLAYLAPHVPKIEAAILAMRNTVKIIHIELTDWPE